VAAKKAARAAKVAKAPKTGTLTPSAELAAVIGDGLVARTEVVKKIWDYIKAQGLQDAHEQARDQCRREAAEGVRQAAGHDVRAGGADRQTPALTVGAGAGLQTKVALAAARLVQRMTPMPARHQG
jgi:hypothetical protein